MGRITKAQNIETLIESEVTMAEIVSKRGVFISTGIKPVDAAIKGFRYGELVVIGARPSMGKTKFLLKSILRISQEVPVLFCSIENNGRRIANKVISILKNGGKSFFTDHIGKSDFNVDFDNEMLFISDSIYDSMEEYMLLMIQHIVEDGVKVIAIDDLHLLPESNSRLTPLELLKEICEIFKVTVIVTSRVSPDCELRGGDRKPRLEDLSIKPYLKDCLDIVLLLYRPEYYGLLQDEYGNSTAGRLEVIIAKDRENEPFDLQVECLFTGESDAKYNS